jgi:hypothetical protein
VTEEAGRGQWARSPAIFVTRPGAVAVRSDVYHPPAPAPVPEGRRGGRPYVVIVPFFPYMSVSARRPASAPPS